MDKPPAMTERTRAEHALNRLAFGPQPGEVAQVEAMGVDRWVELQLHPESIDDTALRPRLARIPAMTLSEADLMKRFPPPQLLRRMESGDARAPLPADPEERILYLNLIAADKKAAANKAAAKGGATAAGAQAGASTARPEMADSANADLPSEERRILAIPSPADRYEALLALPAGEPRTVLQHLGPNRAAALTEGMDPRQREVLEALYGDPARLVVTEAMEQKLIYDTYSSRQLLEVMTDFWLNHFNVYDRKGGLAPWQVATYERDVIRPNALGKFGDLLEAVATSAAMMTYLDNALSIGPDSVAALRNPGGTGNTGAPRGLNENYARELMELHTLGVNGGYSQRDVTEVAKVFTGWTVASAEQGGAFVFIQRRHEPGDKHVLGRTIYENGEREGFEVLNMLASSRATAHFISRKLAVRFVSDSPPDALVERMAERYLETGGRIREVLGTLFRSPEFWEASAYRTKVKTPLEFVVSSLRATQADVSNPTVLFQGLERLGMPLFGMQPPTGYPMTAEAWVSSEGLLTRMNFALALAANRLNGVRWNIAGAEGPADAAQEDPLQQEDRLEQAFLDGSVSEHTRDVVLEQMKTLTTAEVRAAGEPDPSQAPQTTSFEKSEQKMNGKERTRVIDRGFDVTLYGLAEDVVAAGLLLGSPEFQRR